MDSPDFKQIVTSISAYESTAGQSPIKITGPPTIETLEDLIHEITNRSVEPEKCAFYIHPAIWSDIYQDIMIEYPASITPESVRGRPVIADPTMPEYAILFMAPDSVTLGGTVVNPISIAIAELTTNE